MKEYRLSSWIDLRAPYDRIAYRRMLGEMSQRHMTLAQLVAASGLRRLEVQHFLETLEGRGLILHRNRPRRGWPSLMASPIARLRRIWMAATNGN